MSPSRKEPRDRNRKEELLREIALATASKNYQRASEIFHELANICFEEEKFDEGMDFIHRSEEAKAGVLPGSSESQDHAKNRGCKAHLAKLQEQATIFFERAEFTKAGNVLKQMIAVAEQIGDPILEANYKHNLRKVEDAARSAAKKMK